MFGREKAFRPKVAVARPAPKILANVEKLRLLSKLERAGLLSALEKNGVTLSALEKSGALSTAESLGLISLVADRWVGGGGLLRAFDCATGRGGNGWGGWQERKERGSRSGAREEARIWEEIPGQLLHAWPAWGKGQPTGFSAG